MFLVTEAVVQAPYPSSTPMLDIWLYFIQPAKVLLVSVVSSQTGPASSEKATNLAP